MEQMFYGKVGMFSGILVDTYHFSWVLSLPANYQIFTQEQRLYVGTTNTNTSSKRKSATALLVEESMLWPAAKSHLSLCTCIISYSGIMVQAIGKVSLFRRIGDFFSCLIRSP